MFNEHFAVVDLETLGIPSNSIILTLGLTVSKYTEDVSFESLVKDGLHVKFDSYEQSKNGRIIQKNVVEFWRKQSDEARKILHMSKDDVSIYKVGYILKDYFDKRSIDIKKVDFYDRNSFDLSKLQDVIESKGGDVPWDYRSVYEIVTALKFMGFDRYAGMHPRDVPGAIYHNALHDSAIDHLRLMKALHSQ